MNIQMFSVYIETLFYYYLKNSILFLYCYKMTKNTNTNKRFFITFRLLKKIYFLHNYNILQWRNGIQE